MILLTADQKAALEQQLRKAREASERNRLCVILGHNDGISIGDLAKALRLSRATVTSYLDDFDSQQKSKNDPRRGTYLKLTSEQSQALSDHLDKTTYLNVKFICEYVQEQFGVIYSRSGMTAWLQTHNFVFKHSKKIPGNVAPQQQEQFIKEYERLQSSLQPDTDKKGCSKKPYKLR